MKKILVLAYTVSPTRGSEYSVAWNYIVNMSKENELVVICGASGNHLGDIHEIEEIIKNKSLPNVRFIPVKPNAKAEKLNTLNKKGILVYSFYFAFNEWHKQVYNVVKELVKVEKFDLIHNLAPIGYREPGYLWKLDLPYVWGPIGGTYSVPFSLMKALSGLGLIKLGFRKIVNYFQLNFKKSIQNAVKNTQVLIAATSFDQKKLSNRFGREVLFLPENAINFKDVSSSKNFHTKKLNLIWIGRIDDNKALIIFLKALAKTKTDINDLVIHIVGDGGLKNKMQEFAINNNLNQSIIWHGAIPRNKVIALLSEVAHLHVITSLTEGNPTTVWEAMATKTPTLTLDHCGMHDVICDSCGIKIPITNYDKVIESIADKIDCFSENRSELEKLSIGTKSCAVKYQWANRISFWNNVYDKAINSKRN